MTSLLEKVQVPIIEPSHKDIINGCAINRYVTKTLFPFAGLVMLPKHPTFNNDDESDDESAKTLHRHTVVYSEQYNPSVDKLVLSLGDKKSEEVTQKLKASCRQCLMFRALDEDQLNIVISTMKLKRVKNGEIVIKFGDDGDYFYVIESGTFEVFNESSVLIKTYKENGSFGELALMYNKPRAATVKATSNGLLWALERSTFRKIILKHAYNKRKKYEMFLETVQMLKPLQPYERTILSDALIQVNYKKGDVIIQQNDHAAGMYFVEKGSVTVRMQHNDNQEVVKQIEPGGYFGERALIMNEPRAATVIANEDVTLAFLDVNTFERLLGPCLDIMKREIGLYNEEIKSTFGGDLTKARLSALQQINK